MSKRKKPTTQEQAKQIKKDIDELRKQWDHLDEECYQTDKQTKVSLQIRKAREKLKKLTDEDY
jgi:SMC interacting uncharacterized protein involved in chromosome segregation